MSSAAAATQNAATPQSTVAAATSSSNAAASSRAAASSSSTNAAASSTTAAAGSSVGASSSTAAAATSSTSSASTSQSASTSASASTSTSASASSSSSASARASNTALTANVINASGTSSSTSSKKGISGGAIGGIVAGAVVGIIVLLLLCWIWRRKRRTRGEKIPPPPPMRHTQTSNTMTRSRQSTLMGGGGHQRRTSNYSSLMAPPRPSSTFASHSRSPSSHINYPITTMASMNHDGSPPLPPSVSSNSASSDSPLPSTGANTPANALPSPVPGMKPVLAPIETSLSRGGSSSSDDLRDNRSGFRPRHMSSIDRLRGEGGSGPGSERAPSPALSSRQPSESGFDHSTRGNSPHTSMIGLPSPVHGHGSRNSYSISRSPGGYPRPGSMASLGSSRCLHVGPAGRAPHQGRPIQLTMPTLLGVRPDENGDFFGQSGRFDSSYQLGLDEMGRMRRQSNRQYNEQDYQSSPIHTRAYSSNSLSNRSRHGSDEGNSNNDVPPIPELGGAVNGIQAPTPSHPRQNRQEIADPNTVLQRE
ncbi:uncharacterized protein L201_000647 [Kwoniella dendrophila CBS 6074]|uniref:REJ domain-containing protein n=1 Tax=Kwoniella dendrophila CBS 6074 TaxID=1295534 RepID=A0AAX4JK74_9TREE